MPIRKLVDSARERVVAKISGEVTLEEIIAAIDASVHDPAFRRGFDVISDHFEVATPITTDQVKGMTSHLKSLQTNMAGARWAIVTREPASFGMMRMFSVYAEEVPMEVRVFKAWEEAEEWLSHPKG